MAAVCQILPLSWISLAKANTSSLILDLIDITPHQILHTTQVGYRMATKSKGGRKEPQLETGRKADGCGVR